VTRLKHDICINEHFFEPFKYNNSADLIVGWPIQPLDMVWTVCIIYVYVLYQKVVTTQATMKT